MPFIAFSSARRGLLDFTMFALLLFILLKLRRECCVWSTNTQDTKEIPQSSEEIRNIASVTTIDKGAQQASTCCPPHFHCLLTLRRVFCAWIISALCVLLPSPTTSRSFFIVLRFTFMAFFASLSYRAGAPGLRLDVSEAKNKDSRNQLPRHKSQFFTHLLPDKDDAFIQIAFYDGLKNLQ